MFVKMYFNRKEDSPGHHTRIIECEEVAIFPTGKEQKKGDYFIQTVRNNIEKMWAIHRDITSIFIENAAGKTVETIRMTE